MATSRMVGSLVLGLIFVLGTAGISLVSAQDDYYVYDDFDDGVIDTNLWGVVGPVAENGGGIIIGTEGTIWAKKENLIGMWVSLKGYQNIGVGQSVNIRLNTVTPTGDIVIVLEYIDIFPPKSPCNPSDLPFIRSYIACQWYEGGIIDSQHLRHIDLQPSQWGQTYIFGLEYTTDGSILVWVNGQLAHSFTGIPGADIAYSEGGANFSFTADSVEPNTVSPCGTSGGDVTAKIDWAKAKDVFIPPQRCVGAEGSQCAWPVRRNRDGSYTGTVSVGSILHDNCCIINYPDGYMCNNGGSDQNVCHPEWDKVLSNVITRRGWRVRSGWGPYDEGEGDDITQVPARRSEPQGEYETATTLRFAAPSGARLDITDEDFCQSKRFRRQGRGFGICF